MSDIRALLLTDVVDSTKLSERLGDSAMAEVWAQHDRVARDLLPSHGGREIDKTDGMLLMFDTSPQAVAYAMAYHHALSQLPEPLKARAGLHVGPVVLRENSADDVARGAKPLEVDGLAKPTAARVMSLAQGAQTLITAEARDDLGKTALKVESHGHWLMKGVTDPIEIFEVGHPEKRLMPPPDNEKVYRVIKAGDWWMPVKEIPNNLPQQASNFVGREKELDEIKTLLGSARLVTLLGMGGLGKTRLSLQAAAELMHQFPDGVFFLDLAPITDPPLALSEAAQVLGVREEPDRPLLQTVCNFLKTKRVLMIFDNCEHLIKPAADLAHAVVKAAPHVRLAASSREALRIPGERAYPILPLPVPTVGDSVATLLQSTAVRLFVDRAQAHKPSFELDDDNADAVAELVSRLEGIPLALELAAARVRALSIADINKRLSDRFKILTGGSRVHSARQQTLRALVDWSYDMLPDNEKTLLNRLAIFKGGWDMAAAEAVCGVDPLDPIDVLDLLTLLVEKSLVMLDESGEETRYRMLETIREYAREKLEESGELESTAAGHCNYFFVFAKQARDGLQGGKQAKWVIVVELNLDNLRLAISSSQSGIVDPTISVKLAVALQGFWLLRGYATEGRRIVDASLALPEIQDAPIPHAHALYVGAALAQSQSDLDEAKRMLEACIDLRRGIGNAVDIAAALSTLAMVQLPLGDGLNAKNGDAEALSLFRQSQHRIGEAIVLRHLGLVDFYLGNFDQAKAHLTEALTVATTIKHLETQAECELTLGDMSFELGMTKAALAHFSKSLTICLQAEDRSGAANATWRLGKLELLENNLQSAQRLLTEALTAFSAFEMRDPMLACLEDHAILMLSIGNPSSAVRLASATTTIRARYNLLRAPHAERQWASRVETLRQGSASDGFELYWSEGAQLEAADAIKMACKSLMFPRSL